MTRDNKEIREIIDWATDSISKGASKFFGMSYEEGVRDALEWAVGDIDERPDEE